MAKETIAELEVILDTATEGLANVSAKKMFGCRALKVNEVIFAMVWKQGRINLKLPEAGDYLTLLDTEGANPWSPGGKKMGNWVLVPAAFHTKPAELRKWTAKAYETCSKLEKKKPAKAKTKTKVKTKKAK